MLTRETNFTPGVLPSGDLNLEFNNIVNYINNRLLSTPLTQNLDFGDVYTVSNLRTLWGIHNVAEYSSLTAAHDALPSTGGILFIPANTDIDCSTTVNITKSNVTIWGSGWSSAIRRAAGTFSASNNALLRVTGDNFTIKDLKVDGQGLANSAGLTGISLSGVNRAFFDKLWLSSFGAAGDGGTVQNDGILVEDTSTDIWINDLYCDTFRRNAITITDCARFAISRVFYVATANSVHGILVQPSSGEAASQGKIRDCVIQGAVTSGITLDRLTGSTISEDTSRFVVSGNTLNACGVSGSGLGLQVLKMRDVVVEGNTLDQCGVAAESALEINQCEYVNLRGNVIKRAGGHGIRIRSTSGQRGAFVKAQGNHVERSGRSGIFLDCPSGSLNDIEVLGNVCRANGGAVTDQAGISLVAVGGAEHITINDNRCTRDGVGATGNHSGILFDVNAGTIKNVLMVGNNTLGSAQGTGANIFGRADVTISASSQFEEGHNLE